MIELTNTEQMIMKCIWEMGDHVAVSDLLLRLKERYNKEYARTTISVFMSYLRDKGYVAYEKRSHAFIYRPLVTEEQYQAQMMKRYQQNSFSGSAIDAVRMFLMSQNLTQADCNALRALVDELQSKSEE